MKSMTCVGVALAMASMVAAGCAAGDDEAAATATGAVATTAMATEAPLPESVQQLDIVATDHAFDITPDPSTPLRPGWTTVKLRNDGAEAHQVMFARVKDGVDMAELAAAGAGDSSGSGAIEFVDMLGGVSYIGPGNEITAMVELPEGPLLAMCYVPDADGVAHALMGMTAAFTVSADAPASTEPAGDADSRGEVVRGTIDLAADGYGIPTPLPTGWYHVVNTDTADPATGLHELALLRMERATDADETRELVEQLAENVAPDMDLDAVGGLGAISAGFDGYLYLDLPDGDYLAVDFMPDPRDPRPHMVDGYYATFRP